MVEKIWKEEAKVIIKPHSFYNNSYIISGIINSILYNKVINHNNYGTGIEFKFFDFLFSMLLRIMFINNSYHLLPPM